MKTIDFDLVGKLSQKKGSGTQVKSRSRISAERTSAYWF
jgi:hypothetical protein